MDASKMPGLREAQEAADAETRDGPTVEVGEFLDEIQVKEAADQAAARRARRRRRRRREG